MSYMILDPRAEGKIFENAEKLGFTVIAADYIKDIDETVAGHPDMQLVKIGSALVVNPASLEYYRKVMKGVNFISGKSAVQGKYPEYVAYNIALAGKTAIHNFKYTDETVKKLLKGYELINVNQGYTKCSVCTLPDGIITSDRGVAESCEGKIDVLKIRQGEITLFGKDYGFIGGASGYFGGKLYFAGNVKLHSDYDKIKKFCEKKCIEIVCLSNDKLADIGSIIII